MLSALTAHRSVKSDTIPTQTTHCCLIIDLPMLYIYIYIYYYDVMQVITVQGNVSQ